MLYVQPVLLALRTRTRQRAGVGVAVGGMGVLVAVGGMRVGDDVEVAVGVAALVGVEVGAGVFVAGGTVGVPVPVDSDHIAKSFAMQPRLVVYQPSSANEMLTLCVPSATGTK